MIYADLNSTENNLFWISFISHPPSSVTLSSSYLSPPFLTLICLKLNGGFNCILILHSTFEHTAAICIGTWKICFHRKWLWSIWQANKRRRVNFQPEEGISKSLGNIIKFLPDYTASYPVIFIVVVVRTLNLIHTKLHIHRYFRLWI